MPVDESGIGSGLPGFADGIRVQHEVHNRTGLTKSGGIRGGSQSVVPRTESSHAFNSRMEGRAFALRRDFLAGGLSEADLRDCWTSQFNNSRAWLSDSLLTFLTASSTALIVDTLFRDLVWRKRVWESSATSES